MKKIMPIGADAPEKEEEALPKSITIMDSAGRTVKVSQPLERIAVWDSTPAEVIRALGAGDKIVGIADYMADPMYSYFWPELQDRPTIGSWHHPDYEKVIGVRSQVLFSRVGYPPRAEGKLEPAGIKIIWIDFYKVGNVTDIKTLGLILGKGKEAEEFASFLQSKIDLIDERVNEIKPEERKRVFFESGYKDYFNWYLLDKAGGINIFADTGVSSSWVDLAEILVREPDVVIKGAHAAKLRGYTATDTRDFEAKRDEMMSRPGWNKLKAVKDGQVYIQGGGLYGPKTVINLCYLAKLLYPDRFEDLDVEAFHREFLEKYQGLEFKGIYVHPCPWAE